MIEQKIKKLRIEIDYISKLLACVVVFSSSVRSKVTDNLTLSKMWLGKVLGELKSKNPYPESMNPGNNIIEPEADCYSGPVSMGSLNTVGSIKELRRLIENLMPEYDIDYDGVPFHPYSKPALLLKESEMRLMEAKLWLGIELGLYRDFIPAFHNGKNACDGGIAGSEKISVDTLKQKKEVPGDQLGRWPVDRNIAGEKFNAERK